MLNYTKMTCEHRPYLKTRNESAQIKAESKNNIEQFSQSSVLCLLTHNRQTLARLNPYNPYPNGSALGDFSE